MSALASWPRPGSRDDSTSRHVSTPSVTSLRACTRVVTVTLAQPRWAPIVIARDPDSATTVLPRGRKALEERCR